MMNVLQMTMTLILQKSMAAQFMRNQGTAVRTMKIVSLNQSQQFEFVVNKLQLSLFQNLVYLFWEQMIRTLVMEAVVLQPVQMYQVVQVTNKLACNIKIHRCGI